MNKKIWIMLFTIIFLFSNQTVAIDISKINNCTADSEIDIFFVDDDNTNGPWKGTIQEPYKHIMDGVKNASSGDIIYVLNGTYYEQILIDKPLIILGENKLGTIIDGSYQGNVAEINSNDVIIESFTIRNSGGFQSNSGLDINGNHNQISEMIFYRVKTAIGLKNVENNQIHDCLFHTNGEGVLIKNSFNTLVDKCEFSHNAIGIDINESTNIDLKNIYIHECGIGIFANKSSNIEINHSAINDNNDNQGGCFIYSSSNIDIFNSAICHNGVGLKIFNSNNFLIKNCNLNNNTHSSVYLKYGTENFIIENCEIIGNFRWGVYVIESHCTLKNNNIYHNLIDSIHTSYGFINARSNWWGKLTGPYFSGFRYVDKITWDGGRYVFVPWKLRPINNAGMDWDVLSSLTKFEVHGYFDDPLILPGLDSDKDRIPDWWETEYNYNPNIWDDHENLDPDGDALNNILECYAFSYGADPFFKDVFLEFDWIEANDPSCTNIPNSALLEKIINNFKDHDINLHIDTGNLGGGEEIPWINNFNYDKLKDLYWDYFLHNDLNNPRKNIFHYGLICDSGPGDGFAFIGWAHLNSFCISAYNLENNQERFTRDLMIVHGSMHELGHTMGLIVDDFGGNDNRASIKPWYKEYWTYRNYKSLMNYRYTYHILDFSDGNNGKFDYDDWKNFEYDFFKNTHLEWPKNI